MVRHIYWHNSWTKLLQREGVKQKTRPKVPKPKIGYKLNSLPMEESSSKLDSFFNLIKDGEWHSLTQLSKELSLPNEQLAKIAEILSEQGIIQYREEAGLVKFDLEWSSVLSENEPEEKVEHKPPVGTFIIPSQESVTIQNVQITNVTEKEVELWIKVRKKFTEIAISKIT